MASMTHTARSVTAFDLLTQAQIWLFSHEAGRRQTLICAGQARARELVAAALGAAEAGGTFR